MKKLITLVLIALSARNLFCAEAESEKAAAALCAAIQPLTERFFYKVHPSNHITKEEADDHSSLISTIFGKGYRKISAQPGTFFGEVTKKRDVIVSAYQTEEGAQKQKLVGGLFATKQRDNEWVLMHINTIYVAKEARRQGIGTQMVTLLKEHARNLPLGLYVKTANEPVQAFWDSQPEFSKSWNGLGYDLLNDDEPSIHHGWKDVVTYYSENNSGEPLEVDPSDEESS